MQKEKFFALVSLIPFALLFVFLMIAPLVYIGIGAFYQEEQEIFGFGNFISIVQSKFYLQAFFLSVSISFFSSFVGLVLGGLASYSLHCLKENKIAKMLLSFNVMVGNFSGVPLAFAFIIVLGSNGVVNIWLQSMGVNPIANVYSYVGLNLVYVYFQIPLAILLLYPTFKHLENGCFEACKMLGGSVLAYWIKIGIPSLLSSLIGVFILLFANAIGAYATLYALSSGGFNLIPIRIGALIAGDLDFNASLASALSLILVGVMLIMVLCGNLLIRKKNEK